MSNQKDQTPEANKKLDCDMPLGEILSTGRVARFSYGIEYSNTCPLIYMFLPRSTSAFNSYEDVPDNEKWTDT